MTATNKELSIIAFFLSEYDMDAVKALGFNTRTEAINAISSEVGNGNNYLKLRRDEFDALPDSASSRKGWRNRPPQKDVSEMASHLHQFSFEELAELVKSILDNKQGVAVQTEAAPDLNSAMDEEEIERIINLEDPNAKLVVETRSGTRRVYNKSIVTQLKALYKGKCQLCGENPAEEYGTSICEAHHIDYFSSSENNDASNIVILCPNHHRLIHKLSLTFDDEKMAFITEKGEGIKVKLNYHLKEK